MAIERWNTLPLAAYSSDLLRAQAQFLEIVDTGAADSVNTILHGLGRVPRGVRLINQVLGASGVNFPYRLATDDAWTDRKIAIRFPEANAHVLLEII